MILLTFLILVILIHFLVFILIAVLAVLDDSEDDDASFDKILDLAYCFDDDGLGLPNNWITGYYGYAYLESPGNATNGINDDDDKDIHGVPMVDERRDDGIDNDGDWVGYTDLKW